MRVCLVSSSLHAVPPPSYGGVEGQIALHARGLAARGHDVHVVTVGAPGAEDEFAGATLHSVRPALEDDGGRAGLARHVSAQLRFACAARRLVSRLEPAIVHHHARYPCAVDVCGRVARCTVFHAHNWKLAEDMRYPAWSARRAAARTGTLVELRCARRAHHVIAVSAFVAARVVSDAGLREERVSVVTNAVDPVLFSPSAEVTGSRDELLYVGRIAAEKGLDVLLDALRSVPDARLAVIGPSRGGTERGSYLRRCERQVASLGLGARVRFVGALANHALPARMHRARAIVVPSVWGEPCGVVVLEALACGVPVVASATGGIPELVRHGRTGLLVPPRDPVALARALTRALTDDEMASSARVQGPRDVAARHTWDAVADELLAAYEHALDARGDRA